MLSYCDFFIGGLDEKKKLQCLAESDNFKHFSIVVEGTKC